MKSLLTDRFGPNQVCKVTYATFRIIGDELDPDEVTSTLGIQPSEAFAKGQDYQIRDVGIRKRYIGHWSISSKSFVISSSTEEHAKFLVSLLEPKVDAIVEYIKDPIFLTSIVFWWETNIGHGGFSLRRETMDKLCGYCENIDFHFIG